METNNNTIDKFNRQVEEDFNIKDFLFLCLTKWAWFVISIIFCLGVATYVALTTHPSYNRYADIVIKSGQQGGMASQLEEFNIGDFRGNTNVNNEIHAIQSPANIYEVVHRLNLDMNYSLKSTLYNKALYGSNQPIKASICNIPENAYASFTIDLNPDGTYLLYDFVYANAGVKEEYDDVEAKGRLSITAPAGSAVSDTVNTPIGKIHIAPMPNYTAGEETRTIYVSRNGMHSATAAYTAALTFTLKDKKADVVNISIDDKSTERARDVLNTVIDVYNENWVADKNRIATSTSAFINARLVEISKELENADSIISTFKSQNLLPDVQATTSMYMSQSQRINDQKVELNNELAVAKYIQSYLSDASTINQIMPAIQTSNTNVSTQIQEYNRTMLQRNNLVSNSSLENPLVKELDNSLSQMRNAIITSINNQINTINTQLTLLSKEEDLTTQRITQNPQQAKFLTSEGRNQGVKEQLYLFLLQKREENELSKAFTAYNTRLITPPTGALTPIAPQKSKIYLIAFALGLMLPAGLLLLIQFMDTKVRSRKDLEGVIPSLIGEIPLSYGKENRMPWSKPVEKHDIVVKPGSRNIINEPIGRCFWSRPKTA